MFPSLSNPDAYVRVMVCCRLRMTASTNRFHLTLARPPEAGVARPTEAGVFEPPPAGPRSVLPRPDTEAFEAAEQQLLRVGDLAKMTGKTVRAIHHYEELGLIEPVGRSKGHYRLFDAETPVRIRWISKLQSLGVSLSEIRTLVRN